MSIFLSYYIPLLFPAIILISSRIKQAPRWWKHHGARFIQTKGIWINTEFVSLPPGILISNISQSSLLNELVRFLFYILQCRKVFFARTDFDNFINIVYENLAVSDMPCKQSFFCCRYHILYRNLADYDFNLNFRK